MAIDFPKILKGFALAVIAVIGTICVGAFLFMASLPWPSIG